MFVRQALFLSFASVLTAAARGQAQIAWQHSSAIAPPYTVRYPADVAAHPDGGAVGVVHDLWENTYANPTTFQFTQARVVRFSASGTVAWDVALPSATEAYDLEVGPSGEIYALASDSTQKLLYRLDAMGAVQLQLPMGSFGSGPAMALELEIAPNGDLVVAGNRYDGTTSSWEMCVERWSASGAHLWTASTSTPESETMLHATVDSQGATVVAGYVLTGPFGDQQDFFVAKFDASGSLSWTRSIAGNNNSGDQLERVVVDAQGSIYIGGTSAGWGVSRAYIARLGGDGTTSWSDTYAGASHAGYVRDLAIAADGTLWTCATSISGYPYSGVSLAIVRYDSGGTRILDYVHPWSQDMTPRALELGDAGQVWVAGTWGSSFFAGPSNTVWVAQFDSSQQLDWIKTFDADPAGNEEGFSSVAFAGQQVVFGGNRGWFSPAGGANAEFLSIDLGDAPQAYCTGKANSLGCTPRTTFSGTSSAAVSSGFVVRAIDVLNSKSGQVFYGLSGPSAAPFQGAYLCVQSPLRRTPTQFSGGSPFPANDCSGSYSLDMNAFAAGAAGGSPAPELSVPGTIVHCQAWGRDPAAVAGSSLSNGLRYAVLP